MRRSADSGRFQLAGGFGALDQFDLVAVGVGDEGDDGVAALDGAGFAADAAAQGGGLGAHGVTDGRRVVDAQGDVAVSGAQLVVIDAVIVGQLDFGVLGVAPVAEEGEGVLLLGPYVLNSHTRTERVPKAAAELSTCISLTHFDMA